MKRSISFESEKTIKALKEETLVYFQSHGFKLAMDQSDYLEFEKGSFLTNLVAMNPLNWISKTRVSFLQNRVEADFDINPVMQMVTIREKELWDHFISNYQKYIMEGSAALAANKDQIRATKRSSWEYVIYTFIGALLFAIPLAMVGSSLDSSGFGMFGAISGAFVGIGILEYRNRKKSQH